MPSDTPQVEVRKLTDRHRFEALVDGEHAGYAVYVERPGVRVFTHTEVDDAFEGQGVAGRLARAALDATRAEGLKVENLTNPIDALSAKILQDPNAQFRFDGSDQMPAAVGSNAFWKQATAWITGQDTQTTVNSIEAAWPKK